jgi:hypothetical protein
MINILIRTSGRPNAFKTCIDSIVTQSYRDFRLVISVDDAASGAYARRIAPEDATIVVIAPRVERDPSKDQSHMGLALYHAPYNLYQNRLIAEVEDGFVMYLDDDDKLADGDSLGAIAAACVDVDAFVLWRVLIRSDGAAGASAPRVVPDDEHFGKEPTICHVSTIGFAFHAKYRHVAVWDELSCGDYRVAKKLWAEIPRKVFIDRVLTETQSVGRGTRNDIEGS